MAAAVKDSSSAVTGRRLCGAGHGRRRARRAARRPRWARTSCVPVNQAHFLDASRGVATQHRARCGSRRPWSSSCPPRRGLQRAHLARSVSRPVRGRGLVVEEGGDDGAALGDIFPSPQAGSRCARRRGPAAVPASSRTGRSTRSSGIRRAASRRSPAAARPWRSPGRRRARPRPGSPSSAHGRGNSSQSRSRGRRTAPAAARDRFSRTAPGPAAAQDRARHGPAGAAARATTRSCGNGEESSPVPVEPNMARFAGVSARFTSIRRRRARSSRPQHRRPLAAPDEPPGRLPEQVPHHVRRHQDPPVRDPFSVGMCIRANGMSASSPARRASASGSTRPASGPSRASDG